MSQSSRIIGKYYLIFICFTLLFIIAGLSLVHAEGILNPESNLSNNSDIQPDSNATPDLIQNSSGTNISATSEVDSDSIVPATLLIPDFTGTQSILSPVTSGTDQDYPSIWQDRVVWRSIHSGPAQNSYSDIYLYNISTGGCNRIVSNLSAQSTPDIWNDRIVWSTKKDDNYEIYLYNISTNEAVRITNDSVIQVNPRIWGDHVVWQSGIDTSPREAVYLYTISTGLLKQLDGGSGYAMSPSIWEDRIVWQDGRNGNDYDIYLYNTSSGIETQITVDLADQTNPSIWNDSIVWESKSHIYRYDLAPGKESQITFGGYDQKNPRIYENYVVYVNHVSVDQSDISLTDLSTMRTDTISSDDSGTFHQNPAIWDNRIVWTDNRNGDQDIFLFTLGVEMPPLLVDFTQNITQGKYPLTVAFTDMTSGQVDGWRWDFGDDISSDERNPVHTYVVPGSYPVTLTVHNQWQRNGILKENLISVDSEPIPQFSVNQTSGPAPLIVQFTDESSGVPNEWKWEFGDGNVSDEQNPAHRYDHAGTYDVRLLVSNIYGNATLTKPDLISVMGGTYQTSILPSRGIEIINSESGPLLELNPVLAGNCSFNPGSNPELIFCIPDNESGIAQLSFYSKNGTGFSYTDNGMITGLLGHIAVSNSDLVLENFSQKVGNNSRFNYTVSLSDYPKEGRIQLVAWEGSTPEDFKTFNNISLQRGYVRVVNLAYTVRFERENIPDIESAILIFGVSSDWVEQNGWRWSNSIESDPSGAEVYIDNQLIGLTPIAIEEGVSPGNHTITLIKSGYKDTVSQITVDDKRNHIHVVRIGDEGAGEVLNTTFIGHDQERNLDFFMAESPNGLSTFGLASLSKSGNLFRLLYLVIAQSVQPQTGGSGGGTSSGVGNPAPNPTPVQTLTQVPKLTTLPTITQNAPESQTTPKPTSTGPLPTTGVPPVTPTGKHELEPNPMVLLKNLSVVFVVVLVTLVFYLRWNKREQ